MSVSNAEPASTQLCSSKPVAHCSHGAGRCPTIPRSLTVERRQTPRSIRPAVIVCMLENQIAVEVKEKVVESAWLAWLHGVVSLVISSTTNHQFVNLQHLEAGHEIAEGCVIIPYGCVESS